MRYPIFFRLALVSPATLGRVTLVAIAVVSGWLTFAKFSPDALYAGDIGVKYAQARALVQHRFRSLDIPYRGAAFDPDRKFMPIRPPFVMRVGGGVQAIFSPVTAILDGLLVLVSDRRGMILGSWVSAMVVLWLSWRLGGAGRAAAAIPILLCLATPWWFYGAIGWEHAPAVAFGTAAFFVASRATTPRDAALAGLLLGLGAAIRDEVLLLAPALAFAVWLRTSMRAALAAAGGAVASLAVAASIEVWWFHRPLATHLLHAVHLLRSVMHIAAEPNPDVPALVPLTWRERYDTVVVSWLAGYRPLIPLVVAPLAFLCRWFRLRAPLVLALAGLVWVAAGDAWTLVGAPRWVGGLYRLSPFLIFVLAPSPTEGGRLGWLRATALCGLLSYTLLAFLGTDTTGGKSLGPRLLLPVLPLLVVAAWQSIVEYLQAPARLDRWAGRLGLALVVCALVMHTAVTIPAYAGRSADDGAAVQWLRTSPTAVVVADDYATAQLLLPLYFQKAIFLADSQSLANDLAATLAKQQLGQLVVVSRRPFEDRFNLPGYRRSSSTLVGRMTIEEWHH